MKPLQWLIIGSSATIGGYLPVWFGASLFSIWGFLGSLIGAAVGIYLYHQLDL